MAVAMVKVHFANGFFVNWSCQAGKGHGFEYNLALIGMALALVLMGGGAYSLDAKFCRCESK
jgi:putative oxidoreductase